MTVTQVGPETAILDDHKGLKQFMGIKKDADGKVIGFEQPFGDYKKTSTAGHLLKLFWLLLLPFAGIYSLLMMIIHAFTMDKARKTSFFNSRRLQTWAEFLNVVGYSFIFFLILAVGVGKGAKTVSSIAIILSGIGAAYAIYKARKQAKREDHAREERIRVLAKAKNPAKLDEVDNIDEREILAGKKSKLLKNAKCSLNWTTAAVVLFIITIIFWNFYHFW